MLRSNCCGDHIWDLLQLFTLWEQSLNRRGRDHRSLLLKCHILSRLLSYKSAIRSERVLQRLMILLQLLELQIELLFAVLRRRLIRLWHCICWLSLTTVWWLSVDPSYVALHPFKLKDILFLGALRLLLRWKPHRWSLVILLLLYIPILQSNTCIFFPVTLAIFISVFIFQI